MPVAGIVRVALIPQGLYVYFDLPLVPRPIDVSSWFLRIDSWQQILGNGQAYPNRCQFATTRGAFNPGGDRCSYNALSHDVEGQNGAFVEAFFGFPITRT